MIQKSEYVLEVISRDRKPVKFQCPEDCPVGERVDILTQMLRHELDKAKAQADKLKREAGQIKVGDK